LRDTNFCTSLARLVALKNSRQNGPNLCKSSCHEVTSEFFATNAPDPPHWTLNSWFGVFRTIWVHLGPFFAQQHSVQNGSTGAKVRATKSRWNFSQRTHPIHPIGLQTFVFMQFVLFWCIWDYLVA